MNETPQAVQQPLHLDFSQFALALESLGDAVTIVGSNDRIIYANGACQRVYGYSKTELIGEPALILVPPGEESVADEVIRAAPGEKWEGEVVRVRKGGGKFLAQLTVTLIRSVDQQEVVGRVVVHRDVTKRTRVEESLRRSETRNRALLSAIPDSMVRITRDGTTLDYVSTENLLALASDAWLGKHVSEVLPEDFTQQLLHCAERALTTGDIQVLEFQIPVPLPDGDPRDCEARLVVSGEDEVLAIVRDVTGRKRLEQQLLQAQKMEAGGWRGTRL